MEATDKHAKDYLDKRLQGVIDTLLQLRDTVRLDLHLASMDARDKWNNDLEPKVFKIEQDAKRGAASVKEELHRVALDVADDVRKFAASLK